MLLAAFFLGLAGSWHCLGMCGPIALMVPGARGKNRFVSGFLYHGGKILAYMLIGAIFGMVPAFIHSFKIQAIITLSVGATMLLMAFTPFLLNQIEKKGYSLFNNWFKLKNKIVNSLKKNRIEYSFYIGFLNGFIPCGMVYFAALGAMSQPSFISGIAFMFLFGLGTIPFMGLFILITGYFKTHFQKFALRFRTFAFILTGLFMIWKGITHLDKTIQPPLEAEKYYQCGVGLSHFE